jgi:hypothetical protein
LVIRVHVPESSAISALHRNLEKNSLHQQLGKLSGKYIYLLAHETIESFILYNMTTEVANTSFQHVTKDDFKIVLREIGWRCVDWIHLAHVRDQC